MTNNEIYTRQEFRDLGYEVNNYVLNTLVGKFPAKLEMKAWGKNRKLRAFFKFEDGRKIIAPAYPYQRYLGLCELPIGTDVLLTYEEVTEERVYLTEVEVPEPEENPEQEENPSA